MKIRVRLSWVEALLLIGIAKALDSSNFIEELEKIALLVHFFDIINSYDGTYTYFVNYLKLLNYNQFNEINQPDISSLIWTYTRRGIAKALLSRNQKDSFSLSDLLGQLSSINYKKLSSYSKRVLNVLLWYILTEECSSFHEIKKIASKISLQVRYDLVKGLLEISPLLYNVLDKIEEKLLRYTTNLIVESLYLEFLKKDININLDELWGPLNYLVYDKIGVKLAPHIISNYYRQLIYRNVYEKKFGATLYDFYGYYEKPLLYNSSKNFTLIFGNIRNYFRNAIWELMQDIEEFNIINNSNLNLITSHITWLKLKENNFVIKRAMIKYKNGLLEVPLHNEIEVKIAIILSLPFLEEVKLHQILASALESKGVILVNPAKSSLRADDKLISHKLFEKYKINSPSYVFVARSFNIGKIDYYLNKLKANEVVVKPVHGTEGWGVKYFKINHDEKKRNEIKDYVMKLLKYDDVLIEEFRGNITFRNRKVTIRVVVSWNGRTFDIESGYAIVAGENNSIATVSQGGQVCNINQVLSHLEYHGNILSISKSLLRQLKEFCTKVARAINDNLLPQDFLKYMGIDLVLEYRDGKILPVVLEVNSRPSGLTYLTTITLSSHGEVNIFKNLLKFVKEVLESEEHDIES